MKLLRHRCSYPVVFFLSFSFVHCFNVKSRFPGLSLAEESWIRQINPAWVRWTDVEMRN